MQNKSISGNADPGLALQGIGYLTRTGISLASIALDINQYEAPPKEGNDSTDTFTHIDLDQTAAGVSTTQEKRCLDNTFRDHDDKVFGEVRGRSQWVSVEDIEDEFLKNGWDVESDSSKELIESYVESRTRDWVATQIWGFQTVDGERRYCRNILIQTVKRNDKNEIEEFLQRHDFRFVYDYEA